MYIYICNFFINHIVITLPYADYNGANYSRAVLSG